MTCNRSWLILQRPILLGTALTSVGVIHGSIHVKICHVWIAGIIYTVSRLLSKNYDDNHLIKS